MRIVYLRFSLAINLLVSETGYVKATEVQGESKEVGAKVIYQGREMTVSKGIDSDGELKMTDISGVVALAEMLKSNSTLTDVEYAAPHLVLPSAAADTCVFPLFAASQGLALMERPPSTLPRASRRTQPSPRSSMPPHTHSPTVSSP